MLGVGIRPGLSIINFCIWSDLKSKLRIIFLLFIVVSLAAIFGASYVKYRVRKALPIDAKSIEFAAGGGIKAEKVHYTGTRGGRTEWELEAETAAYSETDETTRLTDVEVLFYAESGADFKLSSKLGSYDAASGLIDVSGAVTVVSSDGYELKTERLGYSETTRKISTDSRVVIESERMKVVGNALVIDMDSEKLSLFNGVKAEITDGIN